MDQIAKALTLMEQNESDEAIEILNTYLHSANNEEKLQIAELYLEFGFIQHAKDIIESLLNEDPNNSEYKTNLANIYIELEDDDQAFHLLNDIKSDDPKYIQALIQLADLYEAQGLYEVAEQKLYEAKRHDPNEKVIDLALGELLFSIGKYNQCIDFYKRVLADTEQLGHVSIVSRLAEAYAAIGKYEKALEYFQKDDSNDPDLLFKYGLTAFHLKRTDIAVSVWERVLEIDPHYYTVYYYLGSAYQEEGMIEEAYQIAKEGLQFDEHNDKLFYLTAVLAHQNHEYTESETFIRAAIELDPDQRESILFFIKLLTESDRYEEIVAFIKDIRSYNVYDPLYEWELARAYNELDLTEQAIPHYEDAYKSLQHDVVFLQEYGMFLAEIGRSDAAINVLSKYLKHEPLDDHIAEYVNRLNELYE